MKKKTKKRPSTQGAANPKRFDLDKGRSIELNDIVHGAEDLSDQRRMDEFRSKVELERGFAEAWLTKDGEDPAEVGTYLYRRIAMVRGEPNRALYKLGMLDVARRCICSIVMLEWAESSLDVVWQSVTQTPVINHSTLLAARFAYGEKDYALAMRICTRAVDVALKSQQLDHAVPELQRLEGDICLAMGNLQSAADFFSLAEVSANNLQNYMPALWNRLYVSKSCLYREKKDETRRRQCVQLYEENIRKYSDLDNDNEEAERRLREFVVKPPVLREAVSR
jgi:tetratricopeptide (TPR) repeat protein